MNGQYRSNGEKPSRRSKLFPASMNIPKKKKKKKSCSSLQIQITNLSKSAAGKLDLPIGFIKAIVGSSLQVKYIAK